MNFEIIKLLASKWGVPICAVIAIVFLIMQAENVLLWKGAICEFFSKFSTKAQKAALSSKLRGSIIKTISKLEMEKDIIPSDLKVEWVSSEETESFLTEDQVIVRIKKKSNPQENLINATAAFVNAGMLYNYRRYLDKMVMKAANLNMIRKIVQSSGRNSLTYFEEEYLPPCLSLDEEIGDFYIKLKDIDKNGMFINILLRELSKAAGSLFGEDPDECLIVESRELVRFLHNIAMRESNEESLLQIKNNYFKIAIILTAKDRTLKKSGIKPYIHSIKSYISKGYDTIYMFGIGQKIITAQDIAKYINEDSENMYFATQHEYEHVFKDGHRKKAVVYEISAKY